MILLQAARTESLGHCLWWLHHAARKAVFSALLLALISVHDEATAANTPANAPKLNGQHFRITAIEGGRFLQVPHAGEADDYSGFLIEILKQVATKANFTYELLTPSGFGKDCEPKLELNPDQQQQQQEEEAYSESYHAQYNCGINDVVELQGTSVATDMYWGLYYLTPERQIDAWSTIPYQPPFRATPVMYGTATGLETIQDLVEQQASGKQPPACMQGSSAVIDFVQDGFPDLKIKRFFGEDEAIYESMVSGECPIHIDDRILAAQFVLEQSEKSQCLASGKKIGIIGDPMDFGLSHFAFGVGRHLDRHVVDALSYWINVFMIDGTLAKLYEGISATGRECGYVLFPSNGESRLLSEWAIALVALGAVAVVMIGLYKWYSRRLKQQQRRYKKRFVQQIARNIEIGRGPGCIPPEKLSEEILHIAQGKDHINKVDLSKWMHDIKMNFISEKDFNALWDAMDVDGNGEVNPVEFVVFLSACGPEFEKVYEEQKKMPKLERLKLAARRLSNLSQYGDEGVRKLELRLETGSLRSRETKQRQTFKSSSNISSQPTERIQDDPLLGKIGENESGLSLKSEAAKFDETVDAAE